MQFRRLLKACLFDEAATCSDFLFRYALYKFSYVFMCLVVLLLLGIERGPYVPVDTAAPTDL